MLQGASDKASSAQHAQHSKPRAVLTQQAQRSGNALVESGQEGLAAHAHPQGCLLQGARHLRQKDALPIVQACTCTGSACAKLRHKAGAHWGRHLHACMPSIYRLTLPAALPRPWPCLLRLLSFQQHPVGCRHDGMDGVAGGRH